MPDRRVVREAPRLITHHIFLRLGLLRSPYSPQKIVANLLSLGEIPTLELSEDFAPPSMAVRGKDKSNHKLDILNLGKTPLLTIHII
ncbi:MAG: hypothetical protein Ta2G_01790 [Termitinemataceae bacterium]|nr:MAG: hypothetical protein Ta2G_01790 [Termitinemataceae bacterium]